MFHDFAFVFGVERVGGSVEKDEQRVLIYRAGDQDALTLTLTHTVAFHAYFGIVAQGQ